jgi:hypothetical protein
LADSPRLRSGQNLEEADIVRVKVRIDTSDQQTRLDTEIAHERGDALMQGKGVPILDGGMCRCQLPHLVSQSLFFRIPLLLS